MFYILWSHKMLLKKGSPWSTTLSLIEEIHSVLQHSKGSEKSYKRETCLTLFNTAFPRLTRCRALSQHYPLCPGGTLFLWTHFGTWFLALVTFSFNIGLRGNGAWWEEGRDMGSVVSGCGFDPDRNARRLDHPCYRRGWFPVLQNTVDVCQVLSGYYWNMPLGMS